MAAYGVSHYVRAPVALLPRGLSILARRVLAAYGVDQDVRAPTSRRATMSFTP